MAEIDFSITADRRGTNSVKWNRNAIESISANPDALPFWVADMDFLPEEHIKARAKEIAELGIYGYPTEFSDLNKKISSWLEGKHNWKVSQEDVVFTMGLLHGIALSIDLFTKEGDHILVPTPAYRPFRMLCENSNRVVEELPLHYSDGAFSLNKAAFIEHAENSSMILFCSPHNPTGIVFSEDELEFVLKTAKQLNIPVISDEIHADLVHPNAKHIPMGKANEGINAECITFMAPSKTFNIAGEHSAFAVFSDAGQKLRFTEKQKALCLTAPGYISGELSLAAYTYGLEYNRELCDYLGGNMAFIREYLKKNCPEIVPVNGKASFVIFFDCSAIYQKVVRQVKDNPDEYKGGNEGGILSKYFGVEAGIAINDGTWFGDEYGSFVRFNYGTSRNSVEEALRRITKAVKALR